MHFVPLYTFQRPDVRASMASLDSFSLGFLLPTWHELNMSLATAVLILLLLTLLQLLSKNDSAPTISSCSAQDAAADSKGEGESPELSDISRSRHLLDRGGQTQKWTSEDSDLGSKPSTPKNDGATLFQIKVELLAAKNLPAASMSGTSDPYAVIACGSQMRFSSVVPGSRNPMWYEDFYFYVEELPVLIKFSIYDWDIIWKSTKLGSTVVKVNQVERTNATCFPLNGGKGQVCLRLETKHIKKFDGMGIGQVIGSGGRTRRSLSTGTEPMQVATEVRQKPGPLQTIFDLPPDEVRKSLHAFINPAITIILKPGSGGHGVPPLVSPDGKLKYKFASFWNRGHSLRFLQKRWTDFLAMNEKMTQEENEEFLEGDQEEIDSESLEGESLGEEEINGEREEEIVQMLPSPQPLLKDTILVKSTLTDLINGVELPCTAQEYFALFYADNSLFTKKFRAARKDTEIQIEMWHKSDIYDGKIREISFRSVCDSPMCPATTSMSELQHCIVSSNSDFLVHSEWSVKTSSPSSCSVSLRTGVHFKKWCVMQSKIKSGVLNECKAGGALLLDLAKKEIEVKNNSRESLEPENSAGDSVFQPQTSVPNRQDDLLTCQS